MKRSALYVRVSTEKQVEKFGISSQLYELKKIAAEKNFTPVIDIEEDAFIDDGYSGADLDRPALNRLRQAVREGRVDVVLVYDPDRLSRKLYHLMILVEEFERYGVKLEFVTQEIGNTPEEQMFFNMRGLLSEYEREKIKERTTRGSHEKARQGKLLNPGKVPYGFRYNTEKAALEEDPEKSKMLRLIFYTYASEDISIRALAAKLNRMGIPSPKANGGWHPSTLACMLRNEAYIGRLHQFKTYHTEPKMLRKASTRNKKSSTAFRPREEWITMSVPAIVPLDIWEMVQKKLEKNAALSRRNTKREYLLSGLLFCGLCSGRMTGHAMHDVTYYRCRHRASPDKYLPGNKPCPNPEVKTQLVDAQVWETLTELIQNPDMLLSELKNHSEVHSSTREILDQELTICRNRMKSIPRERSKLVEGYRKGFYSDAVMQEQARNMDKEEGELRSRINEIEKQLKLRTMSAKQEENIREMLEKIKTGLDNLDFKGRQSLVRMLIDRVLIKGRSVEIQTIIPLNGQLCLTPRGRLRG
jgi:site-specific DNA recombinase